jgi:hypothetical protein
MTRTSAPGQVRSDLGGEAVSGSASIGSPAPIGHGTESSPASTGRDLYKRWALIALTVGALFRLMQYLGNRSIWLDEALVVPSILKPSLAEILNPLVANPLPFGFLFLERLATDAFGTHELVLRLLPLVAGLASLALFYAVAKRTISAGAVPIAASLFALSPFLIYYASELKQYSSDVAVTLLVLLLALKIHHRGLTTRRTLAWGIASFIGIAVSLTAVFSIAGAVLVLGVAAIRSRNWRAVLRLVLASVPAGVLFILPYAAALMAPAGVASTGPSYVSAFWSSGFMPLPPRSVAELAWFPHTFARIFEDPLGLIQNTNAALGRLLAAVGMVVFLAGAGWLAVRNRMVFALLMAPIGLTLLASGLKRYPFGADWNTGGRVILFLVPLFLLLMAEGAEQIRRRLPAKLHAAGLVLIALLLAPPLLQAATTIPYGRGELKPLLGYVSENWRDGDLLYVHYDALPAFRYYAPRYGFGPGEYQEGVCARFQPEQYLEALNGLRGESRVWVLFTAGLGASLFNEREFMLDYLDHIGQRLDDRVARGTSVYLYDLDPNRATAARYSVRIPEIPQTIEEGCDLWR